MLRLTTLALLGTLGAVGSTGFGAEPDGNTTPQASSAPSAGAVARPEPPVAPIKYLEAGASLFNKKHYDLASKYLAAAHAYRDRLTENQRVVLEVYQEKLDQYRRELQTATAAAAADPKVLAASTASTSREALTGVPAISNPFTQLEPGTQPAERPTAAAPPSEATTTRPIRGTESWRDPADLKQKARWQLHQAREQIQRKQYQEAERSITEVRGMNVKWGYFDDTPKKVSEALGKARGKSAVAAAATMAAEGNFGSASLAGEQPRDRRAAKAMLHDARVALASGRVEEAEKISQNVHSWGLRYSLFDDTPEKLSADVAEARRREAAQEAELTPRSYRGDSADGMKGPR